MSGSGLFSTESGPRPHAVRGDAADLRADVKKTFAPMAAIGIDEWTNPAAPAVAGLKAATAVVEEELTLVASDLLADGKTALATYPRNVTFTTAGDTAADAPASAVITGTDINDNALTETVTLAQTATIAEGVKAFKTITSIVFPAGDGTDATVAIGFGKKFGMSKKMVTRAGLVGPIREIAAGAVVTSGTFVAASTSGPNGTYSPSADPDAAKDYAVYFEYDPTAV
jgi:hypothetical protein